MNEKQFLKLVEKIPQDKSLKIGPGDDAAVIKIGRNNFLLCSDMFIEGVHFIPRENRFEDMGFAAVARTLSDIAAMAGIPKYLGISLAIPKKYSRNIPSILRGIRKISRQFKVSLVGGDISKAEKIFFDTWCLGKTKQNRYVLRTGAKETDALFVSGRLGNNNKEGRIKLFTPRIKEALFLSQNFPVTSMIDISDGLIRDLSRILEKNKKSTVLYKDSIPLNKGVSLNKAFYRGEDYELLFTASKKYIKALEKKGFYCIGEIKKINKKSEIFIKEGEKIKKVKIKGYSSI